MASAPEGHLQKDNKVSIIAEGSFSTVVVKKIPNCPFNG
jgi:hypothetical protein